MKQLGYCKYIETIFEIESSTRLKVSTISVYNSMLLKMMHIGS